MLVQRVKLRFYTKGVVFAIRQPKKEWNSEKRNIGYEISKTDPIPPNPVYQHSIIPVLHGIQ